MNIGYIQDIFPKTSETFVYNEIQGLSKTNSVKVFSLEQKEGKPAEGYDVVYYKKRLFREGPGAFKAGMAGNLLGKSAKEHYFHMISDYFSQLSENVEILHRHFATNSVVYYLARRLNVPYTLTTHAWDIFARERYPYLNTLLKEAAKIITISNYNKKYLIKNFALKEENIEVVRMGIDPTKFSLSYDSNHEMKILSVGRLVEKKGFEYSIKAMGILARKYPDIKYTIVGTGPEETRLRNLVNELKLQNNINFAGGMSNEALLNEYREANIFVLPCVVAPNGDMDGIPVVLMEAMAMGKAVVSTTVSGIPELITDSENGLLVNQKDPGVLAEALDRILSHEVDAKKLGLLGRKTIIENFNLDAQIRQMNDIFEGLVTGDA